MNRVLVIGGTLFIGRALVRSLLERGDQVTILHRGSRNPFAGRTKEILCDRRDIAAVTAAASSGFDLVFDTVYDWDKGTPADQVRAAAAACSGGTRRYVFISSCAVYGDGLDRPEDGALVGEDYPIAYCRDKAASERALFALHAETGIGTATLRPPFVYGPHNPFYREAFFWDRMAAGRPILVPEDGSRLMQFVYVEDLVSCALLATEEPAAAGRAYNVAHAGAVRQDEAVRAIGAAAGFEPELVYVPRATLEAHGGEVFRPPYYFGEYFDMPPITLDTDRARGELGFEPVSLVEGLRRTWEWFKSSGRGGRPRPDFSFDDRVLSAIG